LNSNYFCSGLIYQQDILKEDFNALGTMFLVAPQLLNKFNVWDFDKENYVPLSSFNSSCKFNIGVKECAYVKNHKFAGKSRKGWMYSKWNINGIKFDLLNIHLYHDDINPKTLEAIPSIYATQRASALVDTMSTCAIRNNTPAFIFGDFNVRLDCDVIEWLSKEYSRSSFNIGEKSFSSEHQEIFSEKLVLQKLRQFDREIQRHNETQKQSQLHEFEITFVPTYCLEIIDSKHIRYHKRIPAWCDRIFFTESTQPLVSNSKYDAICSTEQILGDHYPVYLSFVLRCSN